MKKFLYVLTFAMGTCFAANAQSDQKNQEAIANDVNVEVKVGGQVVQQEPTQTEATKGSGSASCCSSKKSKNTASAGSKACCADGKKSDAHCSDKKGHASAGTTSDHE